MAKFTGILWEGRSPLDNSPIVAIATDGSSNEKTGNMVQVWILHQTMSPVDAVNDGADVAICGYCPLRSPQGMKGRACYVRVAQAPLSVWRAYRADKYKTLTGSQIQAMARGRMIRWGAYGDPAMLPEGLVRVVSGWAKGWTGYTHQWRLDFAQWAKSYFMASVETEAQEGIANGRGWGTFRAGLADGSDQGAAILCKNEYDGTTCADCGQCDGRLKPIYIPAHGTGKNLVPAAKLARKKVAHV